MLKFHSPTGASQSGLRLRCSLCLRLLCSVLQTISIQPKLESLSLLAGELVAGYTESAPHQSVRLYAGSTSQLCCAVYSEVRLTIMTRRQNTVTLASILAHPPLSWRGLRRDPFLQPRVCMQEGLEVLGLWYLKTRPSRTKLSACSIR